MLAVFVFEISSREVNVIIELLLKIRFASDREPIRHKVSGYERSLVGVEELIGLSLEASLFRGGERDAG